MLLNLDLDSSNRMSTIILPSMVADTAPLVIYTNFYINSKWLSNIFTIVDPCDSLVSIIKFDLLHVFSIQFTSVSKVCLRNLEVNSCINIEYIMVNYQFL